MTASDEQILDAITDLTPKLLTTLEAFEQLRQNMDPSRIPELREADPIFLVAEAKWKRPDPETEGFQSGFLLFESDDTDIKR